MIGIIIFVFFLLLFALYLSGNEIALIVGSIIVVGVLSTFVSLTIEVDSTYLRLKFGYGLIRRKFKLSEIKEVYKVRNKWYYGWGVRFWFWPHFFSLYNVSGLDAVEIKFKDGGRVRIGSDDSVNLLRVLKERI